MYPGHDPFTAAYLHRFAVAEREAQAEVRRHVKDVQQAPATVKPAQPSTVAKAWRLFRGATAAVP